MSRRLQQIKDELIPINRVVELRNSSQINKSQLFNTIFPQKISQYFNEVYKLIQDNPSIFQHQSIEELNRAEQRKLGVHQAMTILQKLKINLDKDPYKIISCTYALSFFSIGTAIKCLVHYLLYVKTILTFQSNNYHTKFIQDTNNFVFQNIGSFSLTELHHGSYSRGIQTQAVYNSSTQQFIINTNGQQGMKFWIGATASTANMTIMWAQLILDDKNYGPHPFLMRIRDIKTHQVLPGITIGDCGPKNGNDVIDNGYLMVKNVRIPRESLLGKLGDVDQSGKYRSEIGNNDLRFGIHMSPLSSGRASLTITTLTQSVAALVIAIRFACNRRQFKVDAKNPLETLIIDYPSVRYRLMVPLATNIVYYFGGLRISDLYIQNSKNLTDPNKKIVFELHAISSVLKAKASWFTSATITECRQILAGHGYSSFSRLGSYYHDNDVNTTWEGDNNLLLQQTSKYLFKLLETKQKTVILNLSFISQGKNNIQYTEDTLTSINFLRLAMKNIFIQRYQTAIKQISIIRDEILIQNRNQEQQKNNIELEVRNRLQPFFANEVALSYGDIIYFQSMYHVLSNFNGSIHNKKFLQSCLKLWAQNTLLKNGIGDVSCRKILQTLILEGCQQIYPDCIAVTDVLSPPSFVIGSPFAQEDGEGMKNYINMIFTGKKTFGRVPWFQRILTLKQQQNQ